ncbi:hypothetical protein BN2476_960117 [Paraburkholderia piptadeniae]|uniref:Uncharacterized protein n=1 Tax=Paraburkholderia piptadeniae TaxID=1701573 RepID=A0A1N7SU32_9BURK|nr:hypothetical protein BN2476_960117 [Paraburkholderia piptadeniae]
MTIKGMSLSPMPDEFGMQIPTRSGRNRNNGNYEIGLVTGLNDSHRSISRPNGMLRSSRKLPRYRSR